MFDSKALATPSHVVAFSPVIKHSDAATVLGITQALTGAGLLRVLFHHTQQQWGVRLFGNSTSTGLSLRTEFRPLPQRFFAQLINENCCVIWIGETAPAAQAFEVFPIFSENENYDTAVTWQDLPPGTNTWLLNQALGVVEA